MPPLLSFLYEIKICVPSGEIFKMADIDFIVISYIKNRFWNGYEIVGAVVGGNQHFGFIF